MMLTESVDPCRCPLCGGPNACAMACATASEGAKKSTEPCWCTREQFSAQLLQQVPAAQKNKACICQACVQAARESV